MLAAPPLKITTHAIWQYRKRVVHCCERDRSDQMLQKVIEGQVRYRSWQAAGGETFIVECGPLIPKRRNPGQYKIASVTHTFVIQCQAVVTVLGFMMKPAPRKVQRRRRRQRLMLQQTARRPLEGSIAVDISERLLVAGKHLGKCLAGYRDDDMRSAARAAVDLGKVMLDAADEIDRLRSENVELRKRT